MEPRQDRQATPNWYLVKDANGFSDLIEAASVETAKTIQEERLAKRPLIDVDLPAARTLEVKLSPRFRELQDHIWRLIQEAPTPGPFHPSSESTGLRTYGPMGPLDPHGPVLVRAGWGTGIRH